jgi:hypothetical protein
MKDGLQRCFRSVLTYQPDPLRPDRVTVGFVLFESSVDERRIVVRFNPDLRALQCISPETDLDGVEAMLQHVEPEIISLVGNVTDVSKFPCFLPDSIPLELELHASSAILSRDFEEELKIQAAQLFPDRNLEGLTEQQRRDKQYGKIYLQKQVRSIFGEFGVWDFMDKHIQIESLKGDLHRFYCGYADPRNGTYRAFDTVSLVTTLDRARILSLGWPKFQDALSEQMSAKCELHAIVEDGIASTPGKAKDAWLWMEDAGIKVGTVSSLPLLAGDARVALGL